MSLLLDFNKEEYESREAVRDALKDHRVSAIRSKDDETWEALVEENAPRRRSRRLAQPFPLKGLGPEDEEEKEKKDKEDDGEKSKGEDKPKEEGEKKEEDPMAKAKELVGLLEGLVPKLKSLVGDDKPGEEGLPGEPPPGGPPVSLEDLPPGPGLGLEEEEEVGPPRKRRKPKRAPLPPPGAPSPVFTNQRRTRILECDGTLTEKMAREALTSEYPEYQLEADLHKSGNRWVAYLTLKGEDDEAE